MTTNPPPGVPSDRDALISEFLRTSREMIAAQRDVLLTYFGAHASGHDRRALVSLGAASAPANSSRTTAVDGAYTGGGLRRSGADPGPAADVVTPAAGRGRPGGSSWRSSASGPATPST